jgi:hypothetical protein
MEKAAREECTLRALALHAVCKQRRTLDAALWQDVLSILPLGSHRASATRFIDVSEDADGRRTADVGLIHQLQGVDGRTTEEWAIWGQRHRRGGPAFQMWDSEGRLIREAWWVHDGRHREDGPAWRKWDGRGRLVREEWHVCGSLHRVRDEIGPHLSPGDRQWLLAVTEPIRR